MVSANEVNTVVNSDATSRSEVDGTRRCVHRTVHVTYEIGWVLITFLLGILLCLITLLLVNVACVTHVLLA